MPKICPLMSRPEQGMAGVLNPVVDCQQEKCQLWVDMSYIDHNSGDKEDGSSHCGLIKE